MKLNFGADGGGTKTFRSQKAIEKYASQQIADWQSIITVSGRQPDGYFTEYVQGGWVRIKAHSEKWVGAEHFEGLASLVDGLREEGKLVSSTSVIGFIFKHILKKVGVSACTGAWLIHTKQTQIHNLSGENYVGAIVYVTLKVNDDNEVPLNLRNATDETLGFLSQERIDFLEVNEGVKASLEKLTSDSKENFYNVHTLLNKDLVNARASIKQLELTYEEKLRIQEPASYWRAKVSQHNFAHGVLATIFVALSAAFAYIAWTCTPLIAIHSKAIVTLVIDGMPQFKSTMEGQKFEIILRIGSIVITTALFSTLAIWILRYLVRMMISENHLKSDAEVRSIMISTYLALINSDGSIEKEDRQIILKSIFTPPTDGLLKDDGLPLATTLSMLSKG